MIMLIVNFASFLSRMNMDFDKFSTMCSRNDWMRGS